MSAWANVAVLSKAKTLTGGLVARSVPGLPFLLREGMEVAFVPPQHDAPRRALVASAQDAGKGSWLVVFEGINSIGAAELLVGCSCLVRRADLPKDGAYEAGLNSLVGFEVHDARAGFVGVVKTIIDNPGQSLLSVLLPDGATVLIPCVDAFVMQLDEHVRRVDMCLPEGLLAL